MIQMDNSNGQFKLDSEFKILSHLDSKNLKSILIESPNQFTSFFVICKLKRKS